MNPQTSLSSIQEQMFQIIEEYLSGTKAQKQICQDHNLSFSKFSYWLRKYRRSHRRSPSAFIPISVKNDSPSVCIVEFPNGVRVHLSSASNASFLIRLIQSTGF